MDPDFNEIISKPIKKLRASEIRELLKLIKKSKDIISFAGGIPDPRYFPRKELADIAKRVIDKMGNYSLQYSETQGVLEVREAIVKLVDKIRGIKADPEDVIVTTGSQQALDMIARTFIEWGDKVITESPSYLAALGVFNLMGADVIGVKIDENGMKTIMLEDVVRSLVRADKKPKFIYTIPVAHNPGGVTMSLDRKKHLLEIASQYDLIVVEDDPYAAFVFDESVDVTPLKALDKEGRVIYISTLSKILAPGIRLGWIIPPKELVRKLELLKQYMDLHSPTLNQYIFAEAVKTDLVFKHIQKLKKVYREKRDAMISAMDDFFPEYTWYSRPIGGFFVFVYVFKKGFDAKKALNLALTKYKVAYVPGQSFHPDGSGANSMRLSYSYPDTKTIKEGIKRLSELIKKYPE